jgi:hypothetical protein
MRGGIRAEGQGSVPVRSTDDTGEPTSISPESFFTVHPVAQV